MKERGPSFAPQVHLAVGPIPTRAHALVLAANHCFTSLRDSSVGGHRRL